MATAALIDASENAPIARFEAAPWRFSPRGTAVRLFLTCWLVYVIHFASNTVREIYPALALGDHFSFRVDEYARLHPDLFEKPGYGWHIGNNPGASMLAAIPYAVFRPLIDRVVAGVNRRRAQSGQTEPPSYRSPWPMAREFYRHAWRRGLDIKFALGAFVMQALCMAPSSALGVVAIFWVLRRLLESDKTALWLSLLYAFGTPVFFRTGYLNHNLMLGHFTLVGFLALWNPRSLLDCSTRARYFLGGLAGGAALLFDYSGAIALAGLFLYGLIKRLTALSRRLLRHAAFFALGAIGPLALLWFYQWKSFGNPFLPGQHWMPPVQWIELGYQGYGAPQLELLKALAFDYRFGFFVSCPLMLLALLYPLARRGHRTALPGLETAALLGLFLAFWIFFGGSNYTRLQFNTGVRYMAPLYPLLFIPAALLLLRLPRRAIYFAAALSVAQAWCLAMYRDVERGLGVLDPILHVFFGGFQLPALTSLSRLEPFAEYFAGGASPLPLFALTAAVLFGIWSPRFGRANKPPSEFTAYE